MARVAYVMNETMGMVGLSGRAFLPMLLGFGCTVPAVMATRALENQRDRLKDDPYHAVYVLLSETYDLCFAGRYVLPKIGNVSGIFPLSGGGCHGDPHRAYRT